MLPSYTIRLWSRASGRYLQILPIGAIPYARGVFGPVGPLQMVVLDEPEAIVLLRCASHPQFHLGFHRTSVTGMVKYLIFWLTLLLVTIVSKIIDCSSAQVSAELSRFGPDICIYFNSYIL